RHSVWTVLIVPVLITCTLPRKKKKNRSSSTYQTENVQSTPKALLYKEMKWGKWKKGRIREDKIKHFTQCRELTP
ncbi:unnamed protein product, partial [Staurois parvus]